MLPALLTPCIADPQLYLGVMLCALLTPISTSVQYCVLFAGFMYNQYFILHNFSCILSVSTSGETEMLYEVSL